MKALVSVLFSLAVTTSLVVPGHAVPEAPGVSYTSYKVAKASGFRPYEGIVVESELELRHFDLKKVARLLMPGEADGEAPDVALPLTAYTVRASPVCSDDGRPCRSKKECGDGASCRKPSKHTPQTVEVEDPNGAFTAHTIRAEHVLLPSNVGPNGDVPLPGAHGTDAFTCYRAKATGLPRGLSAAVLDAFTGDVKSFDLKRFSHLCLPSRVGGSDLRSPTSALSCYVAKLADGEPRHGSVAGLSVRHGLGSHGVGTKKEQAVCLPAKVGGQRPAWSADITVDGRLGDWPHGTSFPTDGGRNYIGWDEENVYVGVRHFELAGEAEGLSVLVYVGNGEEGLGTTAVIGSQVSYLPVSMSHAVRYEPAGRGLTMLTASLDRGWRGTGSGGARALHAASEGIVEIAIPRAVLGGSPDLYLHVNIVDDRVGSERSFGATPYESHPDRYMGASSIIDAVLQFHPDGWLQPSGNGVVVDFGDFPLLEVDPPDPDGPSLRIATFNVGHVDIPLGESDLENHIAGLCGVVAGIGPLLGLPIVPVGFVPPPVPPDPLSWFVFCEGLMHGIISIVNDDLESAMGGPLSHVDRAKKVAKRILQMDLDVVALNEVFEEDARDIYLSILGTKYPYIVSKIEHAADTDLGDLFNPHFGAYFVQDSGLMLFSRYPFVPLSNTPFLAPDGITQLRWQGSTVSNSSKQAVAFTDFRHLCQKEDCVAGKGAALVRIQKNAEQRFAVAFSHMQATYGADSASERKSGMDIRTGQLDKIQEMVEATLTANEKALEEVFVLGDLNVIGRQADGESMNDSDWPGWSDDHPYGVLSFVENQDWDLGRQEWLHHFCGLRTGGPGDPCTNANPQQSYLDDPSAPGFFACGDGTVNSCPDSNGDLFLVDSWAFDSSPHDPGMTQGDGAISPNPNATCSPENGTGGLQTRFCSGSRLDYVLHNKPGVADQKASDRNSLCAQHMTIAWELSGAGGTQPLSDHLPLRGDFNRWYPHCRPVEAKVVGETELGSSNHFQGPGQITFPGSMQWYKITEPGSYSIRVSPESDFGFQIYDDEDLSRPRPSYHKMQSRYGTRYQLPSPPYYVRVFASPDGGMTADRQTTGSYALTIHRHDCTSAVDACTVMAGGRTRALWPDEHFTTWNPADPQYASGPDTQWFIFTSYQDDSGNLPNLSFEYEASCMENYEFEIVEYCQALGNCPGNLHNVFVDEASFDAGPTEQPCETCAFNQKQKRVETSGLSAPAIGTQFFLRVLRTEPFSPGCIPCLADANGMCSAPPGERKAEVRFGTDMTFFYPNRLKLHLSEDDWGDDTDELWYFMDPNGAAPTTTCAACAGNSGPYAYLGKFTEGGPAGPVAKMAIQKFTKQLQPNLYSEAEPGSYDTEEEFFRPRGGSYACAAEPGLWAGYRGICPLTEDKSNTPESESEPRFHYSDDAGLDTEEADYFASLYFCLAHENVPPADSNQTAHEACRKWEGDEWVE